MKIDPLTIAEDIEYSVHKDEKRDFSGEPYTVHPDGVARLIPVLAEDSNIDFRLVDVPAAQVEAKLHDVIESLVKQREDTLRRPLTHPEEEAFIDECKEMIFAAFEKGGYGRNDYISDSTTVADLVYDLDSLTHRRYWRQEVAESYEKEKLGPEDIKSVAYMIGHDRLLSRTLMAQPGDPKVKRMTAAGTKLGDTIGNKADNPAPARAVIYEETLPEILWVLKSEAVRITLRTKDDAQHDLPRHSHNVVLIPRKPVQSERFGRSAQSRGEEAAYG